VTKRKGLMTWGRGAVLQLVGGCAADAVIADGSDFTLDDLAANHHRVGSEAANPTPGYR